MPQTRAESIQFHRSRAADGIAAADDWGAKGETGWEAFSLLLALPEAVAVAVSEFDSPEAGTDWLRREFHETLIRRTHRVVRDLFAARDSAPPEMPPPGLFNLAICVHAEWLVGDFAAARETATMAVDPTFARRFQSSPFWAEYAGGVAAVATGRPIVPTPPQQSPRKHRGYDVHWATYLGLMRAICAGADLGPACQEVDLSFARRNRDKRLIGDCLDGDGTFPVKWDFRKHSLLAAAGAAV
jgi:hypothetical protein